MKGFLIANNVAQAAVLEEKLQIFLSEFWKTKKQGDTMSLSNDRIYQLIISQDWDRCIQEIPSATNAEINYVDEVRR